MGDLCDTAGRSYLWKQSCAGFTTCYIPETDALTSCITQHLLPLVTSSTKRGKKQKVLFPQRKNIARGEFKALEGTIFSVTLYCAAPEGEKEANGGKERIDI